MKLRATLMPFLLLTLTLVNPCRPSQSTRLPTKGDTIFEVNVTRPRFKQVPREIEVAGEMDPSKVTVVTANTAAIVNQLHVSVGDVVAKDDELFTLSGEDLTDIIDIKNLKIKEIEARMKLVSSKIKTTADAGTIPSIEDTSFIDDDFDKPQITPQKNYGDQSDNIQNPDTLGALLEMLETFKTRFEGEVALLEKKRQSLVQKSPVGGTITAIKVNEQGKVGEGQPVIEISVLDPIMVSFEVPQEFASHIDQTTKVRVQARDSSSVQTTGLVSFVAPNISPVTKTLAVKASVKNPNGLLKGAQSVTVFAATHRMDLAFPLPLRAITSVDGHDVIAVVQGQQARLVQITKGRVFKDGQILVTADVSIDSRIITEIPPGIKNGSFVKIVETVFLEEPEELKSDPEIENSSASPVVEPTPDPVPEPTPPEPVIVPQATTPKTKPVKPKPTPPTPAPTPTPPEPLAPAPIDQVIDGY